MNCTPKPRELSTHVKLIPSIKITDSRRSLTGRHSPLDQLAAGNQLQQLPAVERAVQIAAGDARMLTRERLGAHSFAIGNGLDDGLVLIHRDQKKIARIHRLLL